MLHVSHTYSLLGSVAWITKRLIWIAYLKNDDNDKCLFVLLPKDIIRYILSFFPKRNALVSANAEIINKKNSENPIANNVCEVL